MFNSPEHRRDDGDGRRRTGAGSRPARGCSCRTPARCISIAFVLAVVTSSVPKTVLFRVFSGLANHISNAQLTPFIANMHTALWCLPAISVLGAFVAAARPKHDRPSTSAGAAAEHEPPRPVAAHERHGRAAAADRRGRRADRHDAADDPLLRGDRPAAGAPTTARRASTAATREADVERVQRDRPPARPARPVARSALAAARGRDRPRRAPARVPARPRTPASARRILDQSLGHIGTQLELVRGRRRELEQLEQELRRQARSSVHGRLRGARGVSAVSAPASTAARWRRCRPATCSPTSRQGSVPALLPFLIAQDHLNYAAASALVLAATISSSRDPAAVRPRLGPPARSPWLMPLGPALGGLGSRSPGSRPPTG